MIRFWKNSFTLALLGAFFSCTTAQSATPQQRLLYAQSLIQRTEFSLAAEEYNRVLIDCPECKDDLQIVRTLFSLAERTEDYRYLANLSRYYWDKKESTVLTCTSRYYLGKALYRQNAYKGALKILQSAPEINSQCDVDCMEKTTLLTALNLARLQDWSCAKTQIQDYNFAQHPEVKQTAWRAIDQAQNLHLKSPSKAAALSALVPGSGYWYAQSPASAVAAVLVNGLLIWASVSSFKQGNTGLGTLSSTIGFGWYLGTILGSSKAADRTNRFLTDQALSPIENY